MNKQKLKTAIDNYLAHRSLNPSKCSDEAEDIRKRINFYSSFSLKRILAMSSDDMFEYLGKLWAMVI